MSAPDIGSMHVSIVPVGSRVTCNPAPVGTDQDWLVLVKTEVYDALAAHLLSTGWEVGGSLIAAGDDYRPAQEHFNSFKRGEDNLIVTDSEQFQRRFLAASGIAKKLNLLNKVDRIALFQAVLYAAIPDPVFEPMAYLPDVELEF